MANAGEVQSMYILAHAYYTGQQVEENDTLAVKWWKKAADALYPDADAWIGLSFAEGLEVLHKIRYQQIGVMKER